MSTAIEKPLNDAALIFKYTHGSAPDARYVFANMIDVVDRLTAVHDWDTHGCKMLEMVNIDMLEEVADEYFRFVKVFRRYLKVCSVLSSRLQLWADRFDLSGHSFTSLDELEKVLDNKAFL